MICKGTTHNNGGKLARYMTTGKDDERAELWQLVGFAAGDIRDAFRSVHVMAEATRCEQPFFHVQVRNPDDEELSRNEWRRVADRIEEKLGLKGQPRAICFHTDEKTGHEHMHVAWSRIDTETMTARPMPFFKERLKEVARELEKTLDLTRVRNERDDQMKAPSRNEFEQARRLGVNLDDIRTSIRDCWLQSDNGRSFEAALAEKGLVLAQGDRRAYVVVDHEGGLHALGKRILDVSASNVSQRLADLNRDELLTVERARASLHERAQIREQGSWERMPDAYRQQIDWEDAIANAAIEKEKRLREFIEPRTPEKDGGRGGMPDPHRQEIEWQDALASAAIEREKVRQEFIDPRNLDVEREMFRDLNRSGLLHRDRDAPPPPADLSRIEKEIWTAYHASPNALALLGALEHKGIALAAVTKEEADRSHRQSEFAKAVGNYAPRYREGEIVAVTEPGPIFRREGEPVEARRLFRLDERITGHGRQRVEQFLEPLRARLKGLDATKEILNTSREDRVRHLEEIRLAKAQRTSDRISKSIRRIPAKPVARQMGKGAEKTLTAVADLFEGLWAPVQTPEQKRQGQIAARERRYSAEESIEASQASSELAEQRRRQELEELARRRERGGRDR